MQSGDQGDEEDDLMNVEEKVVRAETPRRPSEKQPTGRIIGIIKRNWRAYVFFLPMILSS